MYDTFIKQISGLANKLCIQLNYKQLDTEHCLLTPPVITSILVDFVVQKVCNLGYLFQYQSNYESNLDLYTLIDVPDSLVLTHKMIAMDRQAKSILILPDSYSINENGHTLDYSRFSCLDAKVLFVPYSKLDNIDTSKYFQSYTQHSVSKDGKQLLVSTYKKIIDIKEELDQFMDECTKLGLYGLTLKQQQQKPLHNFALDVINACNDVKEPTILFHDIWTKEACTYLNNLVKHLHGFLTDQKATYNNSLQPLFAQLITEDTSNVLNVFRSDDKIHLRQQIDSFMKLLPPISNLNAAGESLIECYTKYSNEIDSSLEEYVQALQSLLYKKKVQPDVVKPKDVQDVLKRIVEDSEVKDILEQYLQELVEDMGKKEVDTNLLTKHLHSIKQVISIPKFILRHRKLLHPSILIWLDQVQTQFISADSDLVLEHFFSLLDKYILVPHIEKQAKYYLETDIQTCIREFGSLDTNIWLEFLVYAYHGYRVSLTRWANEHQILNPYTIYETLQIYSLMQSKSNKIKHFFDQAFRALLYCTDESIIDENRCKVCLSMFNQMCKPESFGCNRCQRDVLLSNWLSKNAELLKELMSTYVQVKRNFSDYLEDNLYKLMPADLTYFKLDVLSHMKTYLYNNVSKLLTDTDNGFTYKGSDLTVIKPLKKYIYEQLKINIEFDARMVDHDTMVVIFEPERYYDSYYRIRKPIVAKRTVTKRIVKNDVQIPDDADALLAFLNEQVQKLKHPLRHMLFFLKLQLTKDKSLLKQDKKWSDLKIIKSDKESIKVKDSIQKEVKCTADTKIKEIVKQLLISVFGPAEQELEDVHIDERLDEKAAEKRKQERLYFLRVISAYIHILDYLNNHQVEDGVLEALDYFHLKTKLRPTEDNNLLFASRILNFLVSNKVVFDRILDRDREELELKIEEALLTHKIEAEQETMLRTSTEHVSKPLLLTILRRHLPLKEILSVSTSLVFNFNQYFDHIVRDIVVSYPFASPLMWKAFQDLQRIQVLVGQQKEPADLLFTALPHMYRVLYQRIQERHKDLSYDSELIKELINKNITPKRLKEKTLLLLQDHFFVEEIQDMSISMLNIERLWSIFIDTFNTYLQGFEHKFYEPMFGKTDAEQQCKDIFSKCAILLKERCDALKVKMIKERNLKDKDIESLFSIEDVKWNSRNLNETIEYLSMRHPEVIAYLLADYGSKNLDGLLFLLKQSQLEPVLILKSLFLSYINVPIDVLYGIMQDRMNHTNSTIFGLSPISLQFLIKDVNFKFIDEHYIEEYGKIIPIKEVVQKPDILTTFFYNRRLQLSVLLKNNLLRTYKHLHLEKTKIFDLNRPRLVDTIPNARWPSKFWTSLLLLLGRIDQPIVPFYMKCCNTMLFFFETIQGKLNLDFDEKQYPYGLTRKQIAQIIKFRGKVVKYVDKNLHTSTDQVLVFYTQDNHIDEQAYEFLQTIYKTLPMVFIQWLKFVFSSYVQDNSMIQIAITVLMKSSLDATMIRLIEETEVNSLFSTVYGVEFIGKGLVNVKNNTSYDSKIQEDRQEYLEKNDFMKEFE